MTVDCGKGIARLVLALVLATPVAAWAQGEGGGEGRALSVGGSIDLVSRYVWRGLDYSNRPNFQPSVWASFGPVEMGTWGSHALGGEVLHEQDLWLTYSLPATSAGTFAVTLNDYYDNPDFGKDFFDYAGLAACPAGETGYGRRGRCAGGAHLLELAGTFAAERVPLGLTLAYNFHNDPQSAVYAEAAYAPQVVGFDLGFTAGGVLGASEWYYEADRAGFINLGAAVGRSLELGRFSVPLSAQVIRNAVAGRTYYVLSGGIAVER